MARRLGWNFIVVGTGVFLSLGSTLLQQMPLKLLWLAFTVATLGIAVSGV